MALTQAPSWVPPPSVSLTPDLPGTPSTCLPLRSQPPPLPASPLHDIQEESDPDSPVVYQETETNTHADSENEDQRSMEMDRPQASGSSPAKTEPPDPPFTMTPARGGSEVAFPYSVGTPRAKSQEEYRGSPTPSPPGPPECCLCGRSLTSIDWVYMCKVCGVYDCKCSEELTATHTHSGFDQNMLWIGEEPLDYFLNLEYIEKGVY